MSETKQKPEIEYVNVAISLPKQVLEFLEANKESLDYSTVEAYLNQSVIQTILGDMESGTFDTPIKELLENILKSSNLRRSRA